METSLENYQIGETVSIEIGDVKSLHGNGSKWVQGVVTGKGTIQPDKGGKPYPKLKVKHIATYYRKTKDIYNGIVWIGEEGEYYDKETESLFIYGSTVKKVIE